MYSQNKEEQVILDYFKGKTGTFLSIGENDGKTFSNVRALVELGWSGVCVEPSPTAFKMLKENYKAYPKVYAYPFALGTTNGKVKMHDSETHLNNGDHGLLSTLSEPDYNKWRGSTKFNEIEVQSYRWKTFFNRVSIKTFDVISCDAEGLDLDILRQMNFAELQTQLICVEYNGDGSLKLKFDELFLGFNVIYTSGENLIYAR